MTEKLSRRDFLKLTSASGTALMLTSCGAKDVTVENRGFLDRVMGRPITDLPQIENAWSLKGNTLILDLSKLPEIAELGNAVRIEGEALADPVLVVLGGDGEYYAFLNACTHAGRKIDAVTGTMTLECCSLSGSIYDYEGNVLSGPAEEALTSYPLSVDGDELSISL